MYKQIKKSVIPSFKRWARTGWAAFASMHKVVKIGMLSVGMSILTLQFRTLLAQVDTTFTEQKLYLKEVKIVTQRSNPTRGIILPTLLYSRVQMSASPVQTIEDALNMNPVVDLRERGAKGVQADISLYGGTSDQTMVMLNGINFTDARTGHQSHSLPVDIEGINGINLIDGVPGIGAFTGAVNIITAPIRPRYISAEISGGQYGYLYGNISGAMTQNNLSCMVLGSIRRSDGYTANTDFINVNLYSRITYDSPKSGLWDFQAGWQSKFFGANEFYSFAYPDQAEQTETYLTSLRWRRKLVRNLTVNADISYRKNFDRFELFRYGTETPAWYQGHNYHNTDNAGASLNLEYAWAAGTSSAGADYSYNHIYSNVLGEDLSSVRPVPGEMGKYYTKGTGRSVVNGYLRHIAQFGGWRLQGSLNYGHSPYGNAFMWSLGAGYEFPAGITLSASAVQSMRLPTFTDLYYTTSTHTGNIELRPERARTYRIAAGYTPDSRFSAYASVYYRRGRDIIDWAKRTDADKWESMQITSLNTYGAEISVSYHFKKILREISASYGYIRNDKQSGEYISRYALDYLRNKFTARADMLLFKNCSLDITAAWSDRNGSYQDATGETVPYKPYWLLNARLSYTAGYFTFFLDGTNLLNTAYSDFGGMRQPGIWGSGGVRVML